MKIIHNRLQLNQGQATIRSSMFFSRTVSVLVVLGLCHWASAQVQSSGACPGNVKVVPDFSVEKYLGTWYEYAKYPNFFETGGKCVKAEYTFQADGTVAVDNSMFDEATDSVTNILGTAKVVENAKLLVSFPVSQTITTTSNYWILATDYDSYSVVYSCQPSADDLSHYTTVWILTRQRQPDDELINKAKNVLVENGISLKQLVVTDQSNCN